MCSLSLTACNYGRYPFVVTGPAVVGIILSASLFIVCGVLLVLAMIRRIRRKQLATSLSSPTTDLQISVLEKGIVHPPPMEKKRVQKQISPGDLSNDDVEMEEDLVTPEHMDDEMEVEKENNQPSQLGTLHFR